MACIRHALQRTLNSFFRPVNFLLSYFRSCIFLASQISAVLDAMEYSVYVHDVEHIIFDNLQFMTSSYMTRSKGGDFAQYDVINRSIEQFRKFATTNVGALLSLSVSGLYAVAI